MHVILKNEMPMKSLELFQLMMLDSILSILSTLITIYEDAVRFQRGKQCLISIFHLYQDQILKTKFANCEYIVIAYGSIRFYLLVIE